MIYQSPFIYQACMRLLYGGGFEERYISVAYEIPAESEVLDLCCGDCRIYQKYLAEKSVHYTGADSSAAFAGNALKKNITFKTLNLPDADIPSSDYIVMMASLYQFYAQSGMLLNKLLVSARRKVILTEPVINLADSKNPLFSKLAKKISASSQRFNLSRFNAFLTPYEERIVKKQMIAGGREMLVVFDASGYGSEHSAEIGLKGYA